MRKVRVQIQERVENKWVSREAEGKFHAWGTDYEELNGGPGLYPVAIVELQDGSVKLVHPTNVVFLDSGKEDPK